MPVDAHTNWDGSGLILDEAEVARRLGRSTSTLQKDRLRGSGPPPTFSLDGLFGIPRFGYESGLRRARDFGRPQAPAKQRARKPCERKRRPPELGQKFTGRRVEQSLAGLTVSKIASDPIGRNRSNGRRSSQHALRPQKRGGVLRPCTRPSKAKDVDFSRPVRSGMGRRLAD
jgi:hypothetical protein